jgi:multidrug efflux pump subunit AcrA (membrane-fusion protein)
VSGVVSAAHVTAGQVVEAREKLFEIVDPARLAVEALAYDPALAADLGQAYLVQPAGSLPLRFVGAGRQLRGQALPLLFRLDGAHPALAAGLPVKVTARTRSTVQGVALPLAAVQKGAGGETMVWVKQAPERYAPRRVETRPLDARSLVVTAGLEDGERVVTSGANLLGQVR